EGDRRRMAEAGAVAAFCPTSNLFLGSGLFDYGEATSQGVHVGLATDVGGGTSFSMIQTVAEAYKVSALKGLALAPERLLYLATLAGARALDLDDRIGSFREGNEADFLVLDPEATPLLARRMSYTESLSEKLFALLTLGDDRCVASTWINGERAWKRG
ncbi:MAG: amidohydrolase family protein, partial [Ectothiorhodospiraceae bacterium]